MRVRRPSMPVRLRRSPFEGTASFLQRHAVPHGRPWGREWLNPELHVDDGRLRFAGASACATLDCRGDVVPRAASKHGVERHSDQLHEITDAPTELEGHREEGTTASHAARVRAARTDALRHRAPYERAA